MITILDTAIAMYKVQNNRAPQDISDLDEYIDVENIKAPNWRCICKWRFDF